MVKTRGILAALAVNEIPRESFYALLRDNATITENRPTWINERANRVEQPKMWLLLLDSIAFPIKNSQDKHIAVTCLTRGTFSPEKRERRNKYRQKKGEWQQYQRRNR